MRFAAGALNYTKANWRGRDGSFYPVGPNVSAYFCNSGHRNANPSGISFEGTIACHATTPIGKAIACREPPPVGPSCREGCDPTSDTCRQVYVGHNFLGSEMHWLPQRYLSDWWDANWHRSSHDEDPIRQWFRSIAPDNDDWCHYVPTQKNQPAKSYAVPVSEEQYDDLYPKCSFPLILAADHEASKWMLAHQYGENHANGDAKYIDWSPIYASLPFLRTVIVREPFSWFISKFFWHAVQLRCHDISNAAKASERAWSGWANGMAEQYIMQLCGEDCLARSILGVGSLGQMEKQAESNLRQSFAVVGLSNETDMFYDMVTARVSYMNLSLNLHVMGDRHGSGGGAEAERCKRLYQNASFQEHMMEASPAIAALVRLYKVAVEVNGIQKEELSECDPLFNSLLVSATSKNE